MLASENRRVLRGLFDGRAGKRRLGVKFGAGAVLCMAAMVVMPIRAGAVSAPTIAGVATTPMVFQGETTYLDIDGTGFEQGATVTVSGTGMLVSSVVVFSDRYIRADVTVDCSASVGSHDLTVTNPDGGTATAVGVLTVLVDDPAIVSISPTFAGQGARGIFSVSVTVTGSGFAPSDVAELSGSGANLYTRFDSTGSLAVELRVDADAPVGARDVTVRSPTCGRSSTLSDGFTVLPGPKINSITPAVLDRGAGDATLVASGTGFAPNAQVSFGSLGGDMLVSFSVDSASQITVHASVSEDATPVAILGVDNPDDGGHANATVTVVASPQGPAVFRNGVWFRGQTFTTGVSQDRLLFGNPADQALYCRARGPVVYRNATFYWNSLADGSAKALMLGNPGDIGLCGVHWGAAYSNEPYVALPYFGVYRPSTATFYLEITKAWPNNATPADVEHVVTKYGNAGDTPLLGDWNGGGDTTIGVVRNGTWYLANTNSAAVADSTFAYGDPGDTIVVGDWTHTGKDTPGVFRNGTWFIRDTQTTGVADGTFAFGNPGDTPLTWDLEAIPTRPGWWS